MACHLGTAERGGDGKVMTREMFMAYAKDEAEKISTRQKNSIMNLVERAWSEGKQSAEEDVIKAVLLDALSDDRLISKLKEAGVEVQTF